MAEVRCVDQLLTLFTSIFRKRHSTLSSRLSIFSLFFLEKFDTLQWLLITVEKLFLVRPNLQLFYKILKHLKSVVSIYDYHASVSCACVCFVWILGAGMRVQVKFELWLTDTRTFVIIIPVPRNSQIGQKNRVYNSIKTGVVFDCLVVNVLQLYILMQK